MLMAKIKDGLVARFGDNCHGFGTFGPVISFILSEICGAIDKIHERLFALEDQAVAPAVEEVGPEASFLFRLSSLLKEAGVEIVVDEGAPAFYFTKSNTTREHVNPLYQTMTADLVLLIAEKTKEEGK